MKKKFDFMIHLSFVCAPLLPIGGFEAFWYVVQTLCIVIATLNFIIIIIILHFNWDHYHTKCWGVFCTGASLTTMASNYNTSRLLLLLSIAKRLYAAISTCSSFGPCSLQLNAFHNWVKNWEGNLQLVRGLETVPSTGFSNAGPRLGGMVQTNQGAILRKPLAQGNCHSLLMY